MESLHQFGVEAIALDVTSDKSAEEAVKTIIEREGRIDALVNNAGYGSLGPVECVPLDEAKRQLDVNLIGVARMTRLVLPSMRENHFGRIVNVSSIAGKVSIPFGGWYTASKFALETLSDSLRMETRDFGVRVSIIEPGGVQSAWGIIAAENLRNTSAATAYEKPATKMATLFHGFYSKNPMNMMTSPAAAAKRICRAVESRRPRARYAFGLGSTTLRLLYRILPARWYDAIATVAFK